MVNYTGIYMGMYTYTLTKINKWIFVIVKENEVYTVNSKWASKRSDYACDSLGNNLNLSLFDS